MESVQSLHLKIPPDPVPPSDPLSPTVRAVDFLRKAELDIPPVVLLSDKLPTYDFQSSLPENADKAHDLLAQQRIADPSYRPPDQQKRNFFRRLKKKKSARDKASWIFKNYEVAHTFHKLLSHQPLAPPGVAHALLSHTSLASLNELWEHLHNSELEDRTKSMWKPPKPSDAPGIPWLDQVVNQDNLDYVRLMCQAGLDQFTLDRAFAIALERHSMEIMGLLLAFGAVASTYQDKIRYLLRSDDTALAKLLLSAPPAAMSIEAWRHCLSDVVTDRAKQPPSLLLLCLCNRPSIVCGSLLLRALDSLNLQAASALLAFAAEGTDFGDVAQSACKLAFTVQDIERRHSFYTMLADSGLLLDNAIVREELMIDIKAGHFPLVRLLVDARVVLDVEPHNAVAYLVSNMELDMLEWCKGGAYQTPAAHALDLTPESASEAELLRLVDILEPQGLDGEPIDALLIRAARQMQPALAERLVGLGASVEYKSACAIRAALYNVDFKTLDILVRGSCSKITLSAAIPTAMGIKSRTYRHRAIEQLIMKGVLEQSLGVSLQSVMAEADEIDSALVALLLQHGAPVEGVGDDTMNAVLQAARTCHVEVLEMLCDAGPATETLSKAVPIAFAATDACGYDASLRTLQLLLERGATGTPVHETLLAAVTVDDRLDIVRVLIKHGADANFVNGAAFGVALEAVNMELLRILCMGCPPIQSSIECVLYTAIDPQKYRHTALKLLLGTCQSTKAALDTVWNSAKLLGNPNLKTIIPYFLGKGLNVDLMDGAVVCLAVQEKNVDLLRSVLSSNPNIDSLTAAFKTSTNIEERVYEITSMRFLLENANLTEIGQSSALLRQTRFARTGDFVGLGLLLHHNANIDFESGAAVRYAVSCAAIRVLRYLLSFGPAVSTLHIACLEAAKSTSLSNEQKISVFESLLDASDRALAEAEHLSHLLAESVQEFPDYTQLPVLLIARGAKVPVATLFAAVQTSSRDLLKVLVDSQNAGTATKMFEYARKLPLSSERRYWVYESLLSRGVSAEETSEALVESLTGDNLDDLSLSKLLLEHGASVDYKRCAAFDRALCANSLTAVQLLSQYLLDDDTACIAFDLAHASTTLSPDVRSRVYYCLLQWNISATSINGALLSNLKGNHADPAVVKTLLAKGADPNQEAGYFFVQAARAGAQLLFRSLSKSADVSTVLRALMGHFQTEWEILLWLNMCLEEQRHSVIIEEHDLLYDCMRRFPTGTALLNVLLLCGMDPAAPVEIALAKGWEPEQCTPLIWALFAEEKIYNDVIITLVYRGGHKALPTHATPRTGVTAAFACLLDKTRTPILKALLDMDREGVLECSTPASTFRYFGTGSQEPISDSQDGLPPDLPLRTACMFLGNFDAYRALDCVETSNDGNLHVAALMALPKFVEWLLHFHDPNAIVPEEFDQMIPLALVCTPRRAPWCKIANQEADLAIRQEQCIQLLAPQTNTAWRFRNKTILHIALENGPRLTSVMVEHLNLRNDVQRHDKYLYQTKDGIQYSLDEYVRRLMNDVSQNEKEILIQCLEWNGIQRRYFRLVMPGAGEQPAYYCGLPPGYAQAWEQYKQYEYAKAREEHEYVKATQEYLHAKAREQYELAMEREAYELAMARERETYGFALPREEYEFLNHGGGSFPTRSYPGGWYG